MTWREDSGTHTAHAQGIEFALEPTTWSIWDLGQAKASAAHIANLKACGLNPWVPGSTVKLFYRASEGPPGPMKRR